MDKETAKVIVNQVFAAGSIEESDISRETYRAALEVRFGEKPRSLLQSIASDATTLVGKCNRGNLDRAVIEDFVERNEHRLEKLQIACGLYADREYFLGSAETAKYKPQQRVIHIVREYKTMGGRKLAVSKCGVGYASETNTMSELPDEGRECKLCFST